MELAERKLKRVIQEIQALLRGKYESVKSAIEEGQLLQNKIVLDQYFLREGIHDWNFNSKPVAKEQIET